MNKDKLISIIAAQHSPTAHAAVAAVFDVHPISGKLRRGHGGESRRVFKQFAWLEVGSVKVALSPPTH